MGGRASLHIATFHFVLCGSDSRSVGNSITGVGEACSTGDGCDCADDLVCSDYTVCAGKVKI